MTRMFSFPPSGDAGDAGEPPRDERLGALLHDVVGAPPMGDVNWRVLAERIAAAVRTQHAAPWWSHVERWQRRALPLALAAGLVGAIALWNAALVNRGESAALAGTPDLVTAVVSGVSSADAARSYAGSLTNTVDPTEVVPE